MQNLNIGRKLQIQCYKHDGTIHRSWDEAVILNIGKDYIVCGNDKTNVTEPEGYRWKTKEPAIMYFFKDKWYNVIAQFKRDGIYYYCNIASPYIIEDDTIKYIDYDLDLRIFSNGRYKILDKKEYLYHKERMKYSEEIDKIVNKYLKTLICDYKKRAIMFDTRSNMKYLNQYKKLKKTRKSIENWEK